MPPKAVRRLWAVSAAIVLLLTIEPTAAGASTAQVSGFFGVAYQAAPGEKNDLSATVTAASSVYDTMRFADPGASITPGKGCKAAGAHAVTCTFQVPAAAGNVDLGDGDDAARLPTLAQTGMLFWN